MRNRFNRPFRLKSQKDITHLLQIGMRWKCNIFTVIYAPNELGRDRLAVLVSKKNGAAVERVRIKRVYRAIWTDLPVPGEVGFDLLIRPFYTAEHHYHEVYEAYGSWRLPLVSSAPSNPE